MPPHWKECEAPLRRTQRDGADETIPGGCFPSRLSPRRMSGTTVGKILSHALPRPALAPETDLRISAKAPKSAFKKPVVPKLCFTFPLHSAISPSRASAQLPLAPRSLTSHPVVPVDVIEFIRNEETAS